MAHPDPSTRLSAEEALSTFLKYAESVPRRLLAQEVPPYSQPPMLRTTEQGGWGYRKLRMWFHLRRRNFPWKTTTVAVFLVTLFGLGYGRVQQALQCIY